VTGRLGVRHLMHTPILIYYRAMNLRTSLRCFTFGTRPGGRRSFSFVVGQPTR
jgi:hypothetical protein